LNQSQRFATMPLRRHSDGLRDDDSGRHRELIADLATERLVLGKAQMMRI
jgi:hypothetical protein